jgi:hypothetical protein
MITTDLPSLPTASNPDASFRWQSVTMGDEANANKSSVGSAPLLKDGCVSGEFVSIGSSFSNIFHASPTANGFPEGDSSQFSGVGIYSPLPAQGFRSANAFYGADIE